MTHPLPHLIVIGGGFAGLWAALAAAREFAIAERAAKVTVISRDEYLTVRPRLYKLSVRTSAPRSRRASCHWISGSRWGK